MGIKTMKVIKSDKYIIEVDHDYIGILSHDGEPLVYLSQDLKEIVQVISDEVLGKQLEVPFMERIPIYPTPPVRWTNGPAIAASAVGKDVPPKKVIEKPLPSAEELAKRTAVTTVTIPVTDPNKAYGGPAMEENVVDLAEIHRRGPQIS